MLPGARGRLSNRGILRLEVGALLQLHWNGWSNRLYAVLEL